MMPFLINRTEGICQTCKHQISFTDGVWEHSMIRDTPYGYHCAYDRRDGSNYDHRIQDDCGCRNPQLKVGTINYKHVPKKLRIKYNLEPKIATPQ